MAGPSRLTLIVGLAALALASALAGCGRTSTPTDGSSAASHAPSLSASATAAASYFLGDTRHVDTEGNSEIAYWRAEPETTPTAAGVLAAIEYMSRRYANREKAIVLRIDVQSVTKSHFPPMINVMWNPTGRTVTPGLTPPGTLQPREVAAFASLYPGRESLAAPAVRRVSEVTSSTLQPGSRQYDDLVRQLQESTGLR